MSRLPVQKFPTSCHSQYHSPFLSLASNNPSVIFPSFCALSTAGCVNTSKPSLLLKPRLATSPHPNLLLPEQHKESNYVSVFSTGVSAVVPKHADSTLSYLNVSMRVRLQHWFINNTTRYTLREGMWRIWGSYGGGGLALLAVLEILQLVGSL